MRSTIIIATILAISIAIPSGLLLTGTMSTTQSVEPTKELGAPESVEALIQPIREQLPAVPEPKPNIVAEPPKENAPIKPPEQNAVLPPPKLPEVQAPQKPIQQSQVAVPKQNIREEIPPNFIIKGSLVTIRVAFGNEGGNVIRANLTDSMLTAYPTVKEALINLNSTTQEWLRTCRGQDCIAPSIGLRFSEQELNSFIQLVNPEAPREPNRFDNRIERQYFSVITYNSVRYLVLIDITWVSL